jgi:hypothetical protein
MIGARLKEVLGLMMIGEGVLAMIYPQRYLSLWRMGPQPVRDLVDWCTAHPDTARALAAVEAGAGLWLATRQLPAHAT